MGPFCGRDVIVEIVSGMDAFRIRVEYLRARYMKRPLASTGQSEFRDSNDSRKDWKYDQANHEQTTNNLPRSGDTVKDFKVALSLCERRADLATDVVRCYVLSVRTTSSVLRQTSRRSEKATLRRHRLLISRQTILSRCCRSGLRDDVCDPSIPRSRSASLWASGCIDFSPSSCPNLLARNTCPHPPTKR
jgi:hypothetical protein